MYIVLLILHILISMALMIAVLLQSGRGGGLAGAFGGGGGSQAIFGGRGAATFLSKATTILGAGFMISSLLLAILSSNRFGTSKSALEKAASQATEEPTTLPGPGESGFPAAGQPAPGGTGQPMTLPAAGTAVPGTPAGGTTGAPGTAPAPSQPVAPNVPPAGGGR